MRITRLKNLIIVFVNVSWNLIIYLSTGLYLLIIEILYHRRTPHEHMLSITLNLKESLL